MTLLMRIFVVVAFAFAVHSCERVRIHMYRQIPSLPGNDGLLIVYLVRNRDDVHLECEYFTDRDQISKHLKPTKSLQVQTVSKKVMKILLTDCEISESPGATKGREELRVTSQSANTVSKDYLETTRNSFKIFPGTKWCGAGNNANSYDDIGYFNKTDVCCRAHDTCNGTMEPGETRHNLTNNSIYTSLSCECDDEFYDCLKKADTTASFVIGNTYFDVLERECYKEDYPRVCKRHKWCIRNCEVCTQNTTEPKIYRWFPARDYK